MVGAIGFDSDEHLLIAETRKVFKLIVSEFYNICTYFGNDMGKFLASSPGAVGDAYREVENTITTHQSFAYH